MSKTQMIILAGGKGERFGGNIPKQFVKIAGKTIIEHTIESIDQTDCIDSIIVVVNEEFYDYMNDLVMKNHFRKVRKIIIGGVSRQDSSYAGIKACDSDTDNILFHDAIRPFVSERILNETVEALKKYGAVDVAIPCADTIIRVDESGIIADVPERRYLRRGQTPQGFRKTVIEEAYKRFMKDKDLKVTDDCGIVRHYDLADIYVVDGSEQNIKITYQEDIYLADKLFQIRSVDKSTPASKDKRNYERLKGKVGVVFGSGSGIGADIIYFLSQFGCHAYGFTRSNGCDISDYKNVCKALEMVEQETGKIDFVINTAGRLNIGRLESMDIDTLDSLIDVDYRGAVYVTKASLPYLRETKGSMILFASSSYTRGRGMYSIYSSSKAAVVNFAQAIAEETIDDGIRINVINPERTNTPMRKKNFGNESSETLLDSKEVARITVDTVLADYTGQVVDIRRG